MKKKIFITIGIIVLLLVAAMAYRVLTTRNLSPKGVATANKEGVQISVNYGRPFKKGRLIFGPEEKEALVPYNMYWRLGANEATEITFGSDVSFAGQPIKAGTYRMYTIPNEKSWEVVLNSELGKWGAWEADHALDVLKVTVPTSSLEQPVEQFTIDFENVDEGTLLNFKWDLTKVSVPIK